MSERPNGNFQVPGYPRILIEQDRNGTRFLYMGDNFIAFTPEQWEKFLQYADYS